MSLSNSPTPEATSTRQAEPPPAPSHSAQRLQLPFNPFNPFNTKGRLNRMAYFSFSVLLFVGLTASLSLLFSVPLFAGTPTLLAPVITAFLCLEVILGIKRCHDFNLSGWPAMILILPTLGHLPLPFFSTMQGTLLIVTSLCFLFLCLMPGSAAENKFGPAPDGDSKLIKGLFIFSLVILAILLITLLVSTLMASRAAAGA